jgi:hypothetical protein
MNLDDWAIVMSSMQAARGEPPATVGRHLCGRVYGHPLLRDGAFICTGVVTAEDRQRHTVQVGEEIYQLGQPYPFWVRWCVQHGYDLAKLGLRVEASEEIPR